MGWAFDDFDPETDMAPEGGPDDCDGELSTEDISDEGVDLGDTS